MLEKRTGQVDNPVIVVHTGIIGHLSKTVQVGQRWGVAGGYYRDVVTGETVDILADAVD
jgi:hypothetical protein